MDRIEVGFFSLLLLAALPAACGDDGGGGGVAASVARNFKKDCLSGESQAPDEAMRAHLRQLCACSEAKIAATPMRLGESQKAIDEKVQTAMNACYADLGGAPGDKRR